MDFPVFALPIAGGVGGPWEAAGSGDSLELGAFLAFFAENPVSGAVKRQEAMRGRGQGLCSGRTTTRCQLSPAPEPSRAAAGCGKLRFQRVCDKSQLRNNSVRTGLMDAPGFAVMPFLGCNLFVQEEQPPGYQGQLRQLTDPPC